MAALGSPRAHGDQTLNGFNSDAETASWYWETWSAPGSLAFDANDDAAGDGASGSMQLNANFKSVSDYQQAVFSIGMPAPIKLGDFAKIALDIKVDDTSTPRVNGEDYGHFEIIPRLGSGWAWTSISFTALKAGGWTHIEANIPALTAPNDTLNALTLKIGDGNFAGGVSVHVDNVTLISRPPPITVVSAFDTEDAANVWYWENWSREGTREFDAATDAGGSATSGSLKLWSNMPNEKGYNQTVFSMEMKPPVDGVTYSKIALDVKVDPSSAKRTGGDDYGAFEIILRNGPDWAWNSISSVTLKSTDWVHIEAKLAAPSDNVHHLTLKLGQNDFGGPVTLNVDNIVLIENTDKVVVPPTLAIQKPKPGLQLFASQLAAQYQRQSIRTAADHYSWQGLDHPVTYQFTISDFPGKDHAGFQAHIFLVPRDGAAANSDVDWSNPNLVFIDIQSLADGTYAGMFRYKVNQAGGNSMLYNGNPANGPAGNLGTVISAKATGTWSLVFTSATHAKLVSPSSTTLEVDLPADDAALFAGPLYAYFGVQPNQTGNIGQSAVVSKIEILGAGDDLTDSFAGAALETDKWAVAASDARGVLVAPATSAWWVNWTTPAAGFVLQSAPGITGPWTDAATAPIPVASNMMTLLDKAALPGGNAGFFRLIKR